MSCPICLDTFTNKFETKCCKQSFCYKCYFKSCLTTNSCPLCRNNYHTLEILEKFNVIKLKIQNYRTNRTPALIFTRTHLKIINEIFIFYRNNDYLLEFKEFRKNVVNSLFVIKLETGWQEWKEFDSFISDYNLDYSPHILNIIN